MQNDTTDRTALNRLADDGCPNTEDTQTYDLSKVWSVPDADEGDPLPRRLAHAKRQ